MLLSKTCGLSRTYPFTESNDSEALLTNKCPPAVSINCPTGSTWFQSFLWHSSNSLLLDPPKSAVKTATVASVLSSTTSTTNADMLTKTPIDLEAISLLLAEHPYENLSFALLQNQNHKSLFSDDETRKNYGHRMSAMFFLIFIQLIFISILHRFL